MHNAIKIAIDNGYSRHGLKGSSLLTLLRRAEANPELLTLDVKFWQALGKGLNWIDVKYEQGVGPVFAGRPTAKIHRRDWKKKMEGLMTHLAEGKSVDSYFKKLLK